MSKPSQLAKFRVDLRTALFDRGFESDQYLKELNDKTGTTYKIEMSIEDRSYWVIRYGIPGRRRKLECAPGFDAEKVADDIVSYIDLLKKGLPDPRIPSKPVSAPSATSGPKPTGGYAMGLPVPEAWKVNPAQPKAKSAPVSKKKEEPKRRVFAMGPSTMGPSTIEAPAAPAPVEAPREPWTDPLSDDELDVLIGLTKRLLILEKKIDNWRI